MTKVSAKITMTKVSAKWSRMINSAITLSEKAGRYAYFRQHITGTMFSFHEPVRIIKARIIRGYPWVRMINGNWIPLEHGADTIDYR
jgi:hypothetical protein